MSSSASFVTARSVGAAATYVLFMLLGRWLGKAELGIYVTAFSSCLVLAQIASLGFPSASLRFFSEGRTGADRGLLHGYIRRSRQLVVGLGLLLAGITAAALLAFVAAPGIRAVTLVAVASAPLLAWILLQSSFALAMDRRRLHMLPNAVLRPTGVLVGALAVWLVAGSLSALTVITVHALVIVLIAAGQAWLLHGALRKAVEPSSERYETRTWVLTSFPLLLVSLYASYFFEYNVLFLSAMLPSDAIGLLGAAYRVAFLLGFAVFALDSVSLPHLAKLHHAVLDGREMQAELTRATRIKTAVVVLGFLVLVVAGRPLLALFGEGFADGYPLMLVLAASVVLRAAIGPAPELLGVTGHQNAGLKTCLVGLVATPLLALVLVPTMGAMGGAVSIFVATAIGRLWLHGAVRRRLGLSASVLGEWRDRTIYDPRRGRIETCGPKVAVKRYGLNVDREHEKARAMFELFRGGPFISPEPLRVEGPRIDFEYIAHEATMKDAYVDHVTAGGAGSRMPQLIDGAARLLAKLHSELGTPAVETWAPPEEFVRDLETCGFSLDELMSSPHVPLHLDFCLQNLGYREDGRILVLDPSPDFVSAFHPLTHGPAHFDLGTFLSGIEGRFSPLKYLLKYPQAHWGRVPELKKRLIETYNAHAKHPVDPRLSDAVGFCVARSYFRAKYGSDFLARAASWFVYNRAKGNDPRKPARALAGR